ncbi:hypothetical protein JG688_00004291 [Phytophthora aleatoria]|uniref:Uncharacterized protein n=1 Tax=Phytophthora aleatoria TaxID=2496075 RepID=A0A8J5J0Z4_9STRA|nr:hypothetical protein JG688_00004291 [Phytophthora aleatoria]
MGTSTSKASPLAPTFERMATWDLKASRNLLQTYKDKDMDFGLDSQGLADLVGGDKQWAERIIDAFRSHTGIINALAFICGACLVSSGPALEKAGMIFDALDFDSTEQISMDEMTISLLCCARGFCVMAGVGTIPSDEELETVTLQAYRDLNKGSSQSITKAEFTKWILEFANGTGAPITREVTLQSALEQFRVTSATERVEEKEENNIFSPPQKTNEAPDAQLHDPADDLLLDDPLQQEVVDGLTPENAGELLADQEHAFIDENTDLPEPVAPEIDAKLAGDQEHAFIDESADLPEPAEAAFVATDVDEQTPNGNESTAVKAELQDTSLIGNNDQVNENAFVAQSDDLVGELGDSHADTTSAGELEQGTVNETFDRRIEATDYVGVTLETESDYPTFVGDGDEQHEGASTQDQTGNLAVEAALETGTTEAETQQDNESNNTNLEAQKAEPIAASLEVAVEEAPPEPTPEDLLYEQDDFAQDTDAGADVIDVSSLGENAEDAQHTEYTERTTQSLEAPAELPEAVTTERESEVINAQDVVDNGSQEPVDYAQAGEEDSTVVADPTGESPRTDLNAFDTFDHQDPRFDGSSGLPPPEPQGLLGDSAAPAVDTAPEEAELSAEALNAPAK